VICGMKPTDPASIPRADFEEFLHVFTHELRNRLNSLGLEAADLAEQVGGAADATRLQIQVRECAGLLKTTRDFLAPDDPEAERPTLNAAIAQLRARKTI
jgi:signal transduction histidine kinase